MADLSAIGPKSLRDLFDRLARVEKAVQFLRSSRNLVGRASVDDGKELLIAGLLRVVGRLDLTGDLSMKSSGGYELVRLGDMPEGDRGFQLKREDGSIALEVRQMGAGLPQVVTVYDAFGNQILAEMSYLGGLANPYLSHPFQPVAAASGTTAKCGPYGLERDTSSTSWETLFVHDGKRQNPWVDIKVMALCSDGTTAGEVQLVDLATGNPLPSFFGGNWLGTIAAGTTTMTPVDPAGHQNGIYGFAVGGQMRLGLQVRRTAGTGSITVSIPQAIGG